MESKNLNVLRHMVLNNDISPDYYVPPIVNLLKDLWKFKDARETLIQEIIRMDGGPMVDKPYIKIIAEGLPLLTTKEAFDTFSALRYTRISDQVLRYTRISDQVFYQIGDDDKCIDSDIPLKQVIVEKCPDDARYEPICN